MAQTSAGSTAPWSDSDAAWMRRALELALRGEGAVEPNPMVGCVLVRDGQRIAEGWHRRYGGLHAERDALRRLPAGLDPVGATWFITLEPCCHHGKTPPCTDAILEARPARVVVAARDPFPAVDGGGLHALTEAGIAVEVGLCEAESQRLNAPYLKRVRTGRPWVIAKWAMTLDGRIATHGGESQWISGAASRRRVHLLRGRVDAVIVGSTTAAADDPQLTVRAEPTDPPPPRTPARVVFSRRADLRLDSQLVRTAGEVPTWVMAVEGVASASQCRLLEEAGVRIVRLSASDPVAMVGEALERLGQEGMTNVLVEGGSRLLGSFFDAGEIDQYCVFVAAKVFGGDGAPPPLRGQGVARIAEGPQFEPPTVEVIDQDVLITALRQPSSSGYK